MAVDLLLKAGGLGERERLGLQALLGAGERALPDAEARRALCGAAGGAAVLSPAVAAGRLGVDRVTLYRWIRDGRVELRRERIGRRRVGFHAADVEREFSRRGAGAQ